MIHLSDRLSMIADCIDPDETVADIGTDHGLLPIFLWQRDHGKTLILTDINEGPLKIAEANSEQFAPDMESSLRRGDGLTIIKPHEVDVAVIAGIGGLLMRKILSSDLAKTRTISKYILQPRNAQEQVRKWLFENSFLITDEYLVREGNFLCEIIVARPKVPSKDAGFTKVEMKQKEEDLEFEISPLLFQKKDPLLAELLHRRINIEKQIYAQIESHGSEKSMGKARKTKVRIERLTALSERLKQQNK